jgi:hypothetical protein
MGKNPADEIDGAEAWVVLLSNQYGLGDAADSGWEEA